MKKFVPGPDRRPCIWPIPEDCLWNGERFDVRGCLEVWGEDVFFHEAGILTGALNLVCPDGAMLGGGSSAIRLLRTDRADLGEEGYTLDVTGQTAVIKAAGRCGAFYGCQTLLQLVMNSYDTSIHGVNITDRPLNAVRAANAFLPRRKDILRFRKVIDFLANYKFNTVVLPPADQGSDIRIDEIHDILQYMKDRHIQALFKSDAEDGCQSRSMEELEKRLYGYIRSSYSMWRSQYKAAATQAGCALPDYLNRTALQLHSVERDRIRGCSYPSSLKCRFKTLDIRNFYNAPLYRLSWRPDDYDFSYLDNAGFLYNSVPFSLFQGVGNLRLDSAFILAGNGWNREISGISVNSCVKGLSFLHSYIISKADMQVVGYYIVHFSDGSAEKLEIIYGRDIVHWKAEADENMTAYEADAAISGVTFYGTPFAIYSSGWINPKPHVPVDRVDAVAAEGCEDGGIALFGITCIF